MARRARPAIAAECFFVEQPLPFEPPGDAADAREIWRECLRAAVERYETQLVLSDARRFAIDDDLRRSGDQEQAAADTQHAAPEHTSLQTSDPELIDLLSLGHDYGRRRHAGRDHHLTDGGFGSGDGLKLPNR